MKAPSNIPAVTVTPRQDKAFTSGSHLIGTRRIAILAALAIGIGYSFVGTAASQGLTAPAREGAVHAAAVQSGAPNAHVCVMQVSTSSSSGSGTMALGGDVPVSGTTLQVAASQCHGATRAAFLANADWSDPKRVCSRYPGFGLVQVMASDFFRDMGNAGGVNYVDGYKVDCGSAAVWDHTLHVVPHTL